MPFLELQALRKQYAGTPLLDSITLTLEQGELACLLGPSGSGKTTLLRLIAGLETPEAGRILLAGEDITPLPAHRRGIGLMFQDYALFPHQSVAQNIAYGLEVQGLRGAALRARVAEMLELVGLQDFAKRDVLSLSGGERQRVALARSLAPRPRLLLLDEPLGALDRTLRERLLDELRAILRRVQVTAITVTHDQEEAFALADHIFILHGGRIMQHGAPEELYRQPAHPWVARFLGLNNLYPATVVSDDPPEVTSPLGRLRLSLSLPSPGTRGWLLILPWGVHLTAAGPDTLTALCETRRYQGGHYRLRLRTDAAELEALVLGVQPPALGERVHCVFDPAALRWLPDVPDLS